MAGLRLARAVDQFKPSDVTVWGIVAMVCGGLAVLSANVSAVVPANVLMGLHATRLDGGSINQVRAQLANLEANAAELKRANTELRARFDLKERGDGAVVKRVGALEVSIPDLLERIPPEGVDPSTTASIGNGDTMTFETDGGSVTIKKRLLLPAAGDAVPVQQPMPDIASVEAPKPDASAFGLALGTALAPDGTSAAWETLQGKVGILLVGLTPLVTTNSEGAHLVAGPLSTRAAAEALCKRLVRVGVACTPVPFLGEPM